MDNVGRYNVGIKLKKLYVEANHYAVVLLFLKNSNIKDAF